ncbi:MAG: ImmA/IrrE family metallo-endopeptidase [Halieaceae bacterium]|nr:ImmA/IrrE family metallo-endopeptidase [Halieaceae bacterium]
MINWPALSDKQIESAAEQFRNEALDSLGLDRSTLPVPVERIAEFHLGYELDFTDQDADIIGGIDFQAGIILINPAIEDHEGRYNFTIAHEIGHHCLHRELYIKHQDALGILCRSKARPIEEVQADRFAEALLMPPKPIQAATKRSKWRYATTTKSRNALAADIIKTLELNGISVSAMAVRLDHLRIAPRQLTKTQIFTRRVLGFTRFITP